MTEPKEAPVSESKVLSGENDGRPLHIVLTGAEARSVRVCVKTMKGLGLVLTPTRVVRDAVLHFLTDIPGGYLDEAEEKRTAKAETEDTPHGV